MTVYEQIRAAYLASGLSVAYIAAESGVSESTTRNLLIRGCNVGADNLFAIAAVVGLQAIAVPTRVPRGTSEVSQYLTVSPGRVLK